MQTKQPIIDKTDTRPLWNPNQGSEVHTIRNWLEDEFINFTIASATLGKLSALTNPYKIPHEQHWIMLSSLYKEDLQTPLVKNDIQGA